MTPSTDAHRFVVAWAAIAALNCIAPSIAGMAVFSTLLVLTGVLYDRRFSPWPAGTVDWPEASAVIEVPGHWDSTTRLHARDKLNAIRNAGRRAPESVWVPTRVEAQP